MSMHYKLKFTTVELFIKSFTTRCRSAIEKLLIQNYSLAPGNGICICKIVNLIFAHSKGEIISKLIAIITHY